MMNKIHVIRYFNFFIIMILLAGCMEMPEREQRLEPMLWLYEQALGDDSATLYRAGSEQLAEKIAEHVLPGSHHVQGSKLLFLDDQATLFYAEFDHEPYPLLHHILPYSYGFIDNGRKVFAVNEDRQLLLRSFGTSAQILAEGVTHVVPLQEHLLALDGDGRVIAYDFYGHVQMTMERSEALTALSDERYAAVVSAGEVLITDGRETLFAIRSKHIGAIEVSSAGRAVLYLEDYDTARGTGTLSFQQQDDTDARQLAEDVSQFAWDEARDQIWYIASSDLYRYDVATERALVVAEDIQKLALSTGDGALVTVSDVGRISVYDEHGVGVELTVRDGVVRQAVHFGAGVLYVTEDGVMGYIDADDSAKRIGSYDSWIYDEDVIIGTRADAVISIDQNLHLANVFEGVGKYRSIYYGDRLFAERLLDLSDIQGTWRSESGHQVVVSRLGNVSGMIILGDDEPVYVRVKYASHDRLSLMHAVSPDQQIHIRLLPSGSLELMIGDEWKGIYRSVEE